MFTAVDPFVWIARNRLCPPVCHEEKATLYSFPDLDPDTKVVISHNSETKDPSLCVRVDPTQSSMVYRDSWFRGVHGAGYCVRTSPSQQSRRWTTGREAHNRLLEEEGDISCLQVRDSRANLPCCSHHISSPTCLMQSVRPTRFCKSALHRTRASIVDCMAVIGACYWLCVCNVQLPTSLSRYGITVNRYIAVSVRTYYP